jgi:hypothetical protein
MAQKKYSLTDEHRAQLPAHAAKWIANAMSTAPQTEEEQAICRDAIERMYRSAKLTPPPQERVVFAPSPMVGALIWAIGAGLWWLRKNLDDAKKLFGLQPVDLARVRDVAIERFALRVAPELRERFTLLTRAISGDDPSGESSTDIAAAVDWLLALRTNWYSAYNGGKDWSAWPCRQSAYFDVFELDLPVREHWRAYEELAKHAAGRFVHSDFAVICDRQERILIDERNRPHCADGPSHAWRCGHKAWHWHGTLVTQQIIEAPETLTRDQVLSEKNAEVQRAFAERIGWERFLELVGGVSVDTWVDPVTSLRYELIALELEGAPKLLKMQSPSLVDGSQPHYVERVHSDLTSAQAARKWRIKLSRDPGARYYRHGDVALVYASPDSLYWPTPDECNRNPELRFEAEA